MQLSVYFGDELGRYGFGEGHPFGPDRIHAFWKETTRQGLDRKVHVAAPVSCTEKDILRFHIVGSDLHGLEQAISGEHPRVFVPIAGLHHARRGTAAGFCVFNDIGIVVETLRDRFGIARVAYVDIDAHHGDGVFYSYEEDADLTIADIHEDGRFLYPGTGFADETGKGVAAGTKLNIPMPPGSDDEAFHAVWPRVEEFVRSGKPEFVLFQAGADSIAGDPITHMAYSPAAHGHAAASLCRIADEFCDGRILAMGGGGYNRTNLALGWNEVVRAML